MKTANRPSLVRRVIGWILRVAVILASAVTLFFCGKVVVGSVVRNASPFLLLRLRRQHALRGRP